MDAPFPETLMHDIRRFFADDASRPRGGRVYDAVFQNGGFFPLQRKRELAAMLETAAAISPTTVMEIGADKGGSFYHWVKALPTVARAIANEIRGVPYAAEFRKAFPDVSFLFREGSSRAVDVLQAVERFLAGGRIDVLFIDGDKSHFFTDFDVYHRFMSPGGIVFMHDIRDPAPGEAFRQACGDPRVKAHASIIDTSEADEAVARELAGTPPADAHEGWLRHWRGASCGVGVLHV